MPGGRGRPKSGAAEGRAWCRKVVTSPEVMQMLEEAAKTDPAVALKLFEHGFGRPPQSLTLSSERFTVSVEHRQAIEGVTLDEATTDET